MIGSALNIQVMYRFLDRGAQCRIGSLLCHVRQSFWWLRPSRLHEKCRIAVRNPQSVGTAISRKQGLHSPPERPFAMQHLDVSRERIATTRGGLLACSWIEVCAPGSPA